MIYIILGTIIVVGLTNFTGMGLSLGRTKLIYNNFEVEDEYKEEVPEYIPPKEVNHTDSIVLNMEKDNTDTSQSPDTFSESTNSSMFGSQNSTLHSPDSFGTQGSILHAPDNSFSNSSTLHAPDNFGSGDNLFGVDSGFGELSENEKKVFNTDIKPKSAFESKFTVTESNVYEELEDDTDLPDLTVGLASLDDGNYDMENLVGSLSSGGLNYVHG